MKISSSGLTGQPPIAAPVAAPDLPPTARATGLPSVANAPAQHQSAVLGSAQAALRELPEIDAAKVAALRDALAEHARAQIALPARGSLRRATAARRTAALR